MSRRGTTSSRRLRMCRRTVAVRSLALAVFLAAALSSQQTSRDTYRNAYRTWRQADPNLERDAGGPEGPTLSTRTAAASAAAASYDAARGAFLRDQADAHSQNVLWLKNASPKPLPELASATDYLSLVQKATARVSANITTFASDQDPGIQRLSESLKRERDALEALRTAIENRVKAVTTAENAASAVEKDRTAALDEYEPVLAALQQQAGGLHQEAEAWKSYYLKLGEGAAVTEAAPQTSSVTRPATPSAPSPSSVATPPAATPPPATPRQATPPPVTSGATVSSNLPQPGGASVRPPGPLLPSLRQPSVTPLPLARYVGGWTYPIVNGLFHGLEPQSVDLEVHVDKGHATGTFSARFKLPPGSKEDPALRFEFSGDLQATRTQVFSLTTSDGTKGSVELIPGNAFNLLEVNFQTELKPGKIRFGDVLLVKK
jgi:hypothetical protein